MRKASIWCPLATILIMLICGCNSGSNTDPGQGGNDEWVTVSGRVVIDDQPLNALILVNGQHLFTSPGNDGVFEIEAPLDETGTLKLSVFAAGLAPFEQIIKPPDTTDLIVSMSKPSPHNPEMILMAEIAFTDDGRMEIKGRLLSEGLPIGGTVIANGHYTFSDPSEGNFDMTVLPARESETITMHCFAKDCRPYSITIPPLYATVEASATSYGSVQINGTIETLVFRTECDDWTGKGCISFWTREPVGATIDANGQQAVADEADGRFELETIADDRQTVILSCSNIENIRFTTVLSAEDILPWTYLSVNPTAMSMLTDTTEIAHIIGGRAPYTVESTDHSVASATLLGKMISIAGLSVGNAALIITDSESYTATIDVSVFYEGTQETVWVPVTYEYDRNQNGYIDSYTYYIYSDHGLLREESDFNHDGTMDTVVYYSCDADGLHCTTTTEYSNNGKRLNPQYHSYDDQGRLTRVEDAFSSRNYVYDDQGRIIVHEIDHSNDGSIDYVETTTYDSHGSRLKEEIDEDNDGVVDIVNTFENTYDAKGNRITSKRDSFNDGTFDDAGYFVYNEDETTLYSFGRDYQNDGSIDATVYFGPDNRVEYIEQSSRLGTYKWERRVFEKRLNIPDPHARWVGNQF